MALVSVENVAASAQLDLTGGWKKKLPKGSKNNRKITCDVCWSQFSDRQHDGCGCGLSGGDTLLPGEVMLSRVAHKLDAFWNGDFNVNL